LFHPAGIRREICATTRLHILLVGLVARSSKELPENWKAKEMQGERRLTAIVARIR
jgi:hypothetical protein